MKNKIIILGFPKCGTSSFHKLFNLLNKKSIHFRYNEKNRYNEKKIGTIIKMNKNANIPLLSGFEDIECITQMDVCKSKKDCYWPQIVDFKQLYYENKESIFILNKRNPQCLLKSFKNWNKLDQRIKRFNPELINEKSDDGLIQLFKRHYNDVELFFKSLPNAKFLSYDIDCDNINKLKKYIDIKDITEFPKENISKKKKIKKKYNIYTSRIN